MTNMVEAPPYDLQAGTRDFLGGLIGHFVDGEVVPSLSGETMPVYDPSSGALIGEASAGSAQDVERAVRSSRAAFDDGRWRNVAPLEKEACLRRLSALIVEHAEILGDLDSLDAGIPRSFMEFFNDFSVNGVDYYAGWPTKIQGHTPAVPQEFAVYTMREPIGVCAFIVPWNGPSAAIVAVVAGLACGNCAILKPAEQTPMSAVLLGRLCIEAGIPAGVVNVLQGVGEVVGDGLVRHPGVDKVAFTGSVETGQAIQAAGAPTLKRLTMELGGKGANIVFEDGDLDAAAVTAAAAVWSNSGQICTAGSRLLVQRSVHDDFVARVAAESRKVRVGSAFEGGVDMGPLVSSEQLARVSRYVELGKAQGAELVLGGGRIGDGGYFHEPTIFGAVRNDMTIAQEEIFGPVMSIIPFADEAEAFAIANDTRYGLASGVWTENLARAHRAYRALRTGTVWINAYLVGYPTVPYGGIKASGYGKHMGEETLESYLQTKSVWMKAA